MEQSYEILECGTKAKTLNPLGEDRPSLENYMHNRNAASNWHRATDKWEHAEDSRVTYEIDCWIETNEGRTAEYIPRWKPGTIVQGQIINGKLHII